jgi:hypothetical protein
MGANGYATTMTVCQDQLPQGIPGSSFNKNPTPNTDKEAKVGRFNHAITAVKTVPIIAPLLVPTAPVPISPNGPIATRATLECMFPSNQLCHAILHVSIR